MRIYTTAATEARLVKGIAALCLAGFAVIILHRCVTPIPDSEYVHRLVTYEGGIIRRALVGEIYSWFVAAVPPSIVRIEGFALVGLSLGLFIVLLRRLMPGRGLDVVIVACFLIGSPLLFKNFIGNLGKFDAWGAIVAMLAVLLPLRGRSIGLLWALCVVLLFMHHLHATIYVPAVYAILLVRLVAARGGFDAADMAVLAVSVLLLAAVFYGLLVFGVPAMPREEFLDAVRARSLQAFPDLHVRMWYSSIGEEMAGTLAILPEQIARLPLYAFFVAIHLPVIAFFARRVALAGMTHRAAQQAFALAGMVIVAGFVATNIVTFDYARHLGNMALCFVLLAAGLILATSGPIADARDIEPDSKATLVAATTVAAVPWTGTVFPLI